MNVLIIKTGYSETLNEKIPSSIVSLGDTLRTTFLLNFFPEKKYKIHWLTSLKARPLLERLYPNVLFVNDLEETKNIDFELIINLEKDENFLNLVASVKKSLGFFKLNGNLLFKGKDQKLTVIDEVIVAGPKISEEEFLISCLGYNLEEFVLPKVDLSLITHNKFQIGLNWQVGQKWPQKNIDKKFWLELATKIEALGLSVSWQQGFDDINEYVEWLDSCETIISLDSLGLHLANQLGKRIIALFGPTNEEAIYLANGVKIKYSNDDLELLIEEILGNLSTP